MGWMEPRKPDEATCIICHRKFGPDDPSFTHGKAGWRGFHLEEVKGQGDYLHGDKVTLVFREEHFGICWKCVKSRFKRVLLGLLPKRTDGPEPKQVARPEFIAAMEKYLAWVGELVANAKLPVPEPALPPEPSPRDPNLAMD